MGGLLLKLQNFKKVKLIFGHPVSNPTIFSFSYFDSVCILAMLIFNLILKS